MIKGIKVIVPLQKHTSKKELPSFNKENFKYDQQKDCYICPEGHLLRYKTMNTAKKNRVYQITDSSLCMSCHRFNVFTNK